LTHFIVPIKIINSKRKCNALAFAPISVRPKFQRNGVRSRLIREDLERTHKLGFNSVIVDGHSEYYPKFGFKKAIKYGISAPFEVPDIFWL
jgi:predicted N-acetyltransferase YhbS